MSKSNFLEEAIIGSVLLGEAWPITPNPTLTVSLHTADPGEITPANEVSGGSYARAAVTFTDGTVGGVTKAVNTADVVFPVATASWGTVTHFVIWAGANPVYTGALTPTQAINTNGQLTIDAGTLEVSED